MRKLLLSTAAAILVPFVGAGVATAQDEGGPPNFVPVELYACSYNDGKDQDDFDGALEKMTDWMEDNPAEPYAAFRMCPVFAGNPEFDFIYFGAWPNGSTMGRDNAAYFASADDALEAWNDAVDCASVLFASLNLKAPADDGDDDFMLSVSDCNVADGRSNGDAFDAIRAWGAYKEANGAPDGGLWAWIPINGDGEEDFDFKLLTSHAGPVGFGDFWQWIVERKQM